MLLTVATCGMIALAIGGAGFVRLRRYELSSFSAWGLAALAVSLGITALAFGAARGWAAEERRRRFATECDHLQRDISEALETPTRWVRTVAPLLADRPPPSRAELSTLAREAAASHAGVVGLLWLEGGTLVTAGAIEPPPEGIVRALLEAGRPPGKPSASPLYREGDGAVRFVVAAGVPGTSREARAVAVIASPEAALARLTSRGMSPVGWSLDAPAPDGTLTVVPLPGGFPGRTALRREVEIPVGDRRYRLSAWSTPELDAGAVAHAPVLVLELGVAFALLSGWLFEGAGRRQRRLREIADRRGRALAESESAVASIVDAAPEAILVISPVDGTVEEANPFAAAWLGRARERLVGMRIGDLLHPGEAAEAALCATNAGPRLLRFVHGSGQTLEAEASVAAATVRGRPALVLLVRDVSAIEHARREAEAASGAKNLFLANVSHEIRTPLNGVLGMSELALEHELPAPARDHVETIRGCARDLLQIVDDVLDFSRLEAGQLEVTRSPTDVGALVHDVATHLAARARGKGLALVTVVRRDLPSPLLIDASRVRRVLEHLVGNAIKFTMDGEVEILAHPGGERTGGSFELVFAVRDTGPGIPSEWRREIFEPFSQGDASLTRRQGGTGIGLALSRQIAGALGGRIEVESVPGEGSTFRFILTAAPAPGAGPPAPCTSLVGLPALVVHRSVAIRAGLAEALLTLGMRGRVAADLEEASRVAAEARRHGPPFSAVIIDEALVTPPEVPAQCLSWLAGDSTPSRVIPVATSGPARRGPAGLSSALMAPFSLDAVRERLLAALGPSSSSSPESGSREGPVLVVEDNQVNRLLVSTILERAGFRVVTAENGADALARLTEIEPSLVLMDVQMPVMDGIEATQRLRRDPRWASLPVVALTAHAQASDRDACLAAGMSDYLTKPIERDALLGAVGRWIDRAVECGSEAVGSAAVNRSDR